MIQDLMLPDSVSVIHKML